MVAYMISNVTKSCLYCDTPFTKSKFESVKYWETKRFCTLLCAKKKVREEKLQEAPSKECTVCENVFTKTLNLSQTQWTEKTLCSRSCAYKSDLRNKAIGQATLGNSRSVGNIPYNKGKTGLYTATEATRKKLREAQMVLVRAGKHHLWKGGITPLMIEIRTSTLMKNWRKSVFIRDNYTCQACEIKGGKINVDHIKEFSVIIEENKITDINLARNCQDLWDTDNGQVLCQECHSVKTSKFMKQLWQERRELALI